MRREGTVAVVGGGVSGALTAYHLVRCAVQARVIVIDSRPVLGLGLAYSTPSLWHLLNVPAGKISALSDEPRHFLQWLQTNYDPNITADDFAPRAIFGQYMRSLLAAKPEIEHLRTTVLDCQLEGTQATLTLAGGATLTVDAVVLATGNFNPAPLPGVDEEVVSNGTYCQSAWENATYTNLPENAPITLIGTGLTAIDVLLRLREQGHRGTVTALSRHGIFPNRHADYEPLAECAVKGKPPVTARELLRAVHNVIRMGKPWRAVIDSLRPRTNELWMALPLEEQKRFRRHLQRRWDVIRHRMAPSIADRLEAELCDGSLVVRQGSLHTVRAAETGAFVRYRSSAGKLDEISAARVINCTGPDTNYRRVGSPLMDSLFAQGLVVEGPLGSGLWSNPDGALRAEDGAASSILFNIGPGRLGTLFESIAVPELRQQAMDLAELLAVRIFKAAQAEHLPAESAKSVA
jgi:hydroxyacylglutathione hydrolase